MKNNIAWCILFFSGLTFAIKVLSDIFCHGWINFLGCVAFIAIGLWAAREVSHGSREEEHYAGKH